MKLLDAQFVITMLQQLFAKRRSGVAIAMLAFGPEEAPMTTLYSLLFDVSPSALARARRYASLQIPCAVAVMLALAGVAIPDAQGVSITSFTVQNQSQANFDTGNPKKTHWVSSVTGTHTTITAQAHFTSALRFSTEKTSASTAATSSRFTATVSVADPLNCGWKLRFSGVRRGHVLSEASSGKAHTEIHALSAGWSTPPTSGSLALPEWDTGLIKKYTDSPFSQSSDALLIGSGSKTVTLTFAWDTYVSSDPYYDVNYGKRIGPASYVCLGQEYHPDNGYLLDVVLQPCDPPLLPYPGTSTLPVAAPLSSNGTCCFDVVVRDSLGNVLAGVPVVADFSGCGVTFCPDQDANVTVDPVAKTATAKSDGSGVAQFCVCGEFAGPCLVTLKADGVVLGGSTVVDCPERPGIRDAYAVSDHQYRVTFDTNVTPGSATTTTNYSLGSLGSINSAVMDGSAAVILNVTTSLSHGQSETVTASGIVSSPDGLSMTTQSSPVFLVGTLSVAEARAPNPDSLAGTPCADDSRYAGPSGKAGARMTIHGVATGGFSNLYYIQDEVGGLRSGIPVYSPSDSLIAGHRYTVAGAVDMHLARPEFAGPVYLRDDGPGTLPTPTKRPLNVLLDPTCDASQSLPTSHDFEGALVRVDSVLVTEDADSSGNFSVVGPYGVYSHAIRVVNDLAHSGLAPTAGQLLRVSGILARAWDSFEIHPRNAADITVLGYATPETCWDGRFAGTGGADEAVNALATDTDGNLYLGGDFASAGGISAQHVALWNGTQWSALGAGTDGPIYSMVYGGGNLYVGGNFSSAGGVSANHIARWDGTTWSALGPGTDGNVYALALDGAGHLYVGGVFAHAGGVSASCIARLNLNTNGWSALGAGMGTDGFIQPGVSAIQVDPSNSNLVYVGGSFGQAGGSPANYVARWNAGTSTWSTLGTGMNGYVYALAMRSSDLYAAGGFTIASGGSANNVAHWSTSSPGTWTPLGLGLTSSEGVGTLALDGAGRLFAGGQISAAGGEPAGNIAMWAGDQWFSLGEGMNANVGRVAADASSGVYAGGQFTTAGGTASNHLAYLPTGCAVIGVEPQQHDPAEGLRMSIASNPSRGPTQIAFVIPRATQAWLGVYDASGRLVNTLMNAQGVVGPHTIRWDGSDRNGVAVPSGVYFVHLRTRDDIRTGKVVMLR